MGRLTVRFEELDPATTQEALEQLVHDALTPEMLAIIHSDHPIELGDTTHDAI